MVDTKKSSEDFSDEHVPNSSWMKFEKVGDYIKGTLRAKPSIKTGSGEFPDQYVYPLINVEAVINGQKVSETEMSLGVSTNKEFVWSRLNKATLGQRIGLSYEKDVPAAKKGLRAAKSLKPCIWAMDPTFIDPMLEDFNAGASEVKDSEIPPFN